MRRALLVFLLGVPAGARAQLPRLTPGTWVRIEVPGQIDGRLVAQSTDSLTIAPTGFAPMTVATSAIQRIKVGEPKSIAGGATNGATFGAVIGGATGLFLGGLAFVLDGGDNKRATDILLISAGGAAVGAIGGGAIGAVIRADRWTTVYSGPVQVGLIGLSIRF
jgi:hypothetical protein